MCCVGLEMRHAYRTSDLHPCVKYLERVLLHIIVLSDSNKFISNEWYMWSIYKKIH